MHIIPYDVNVKLMLREGILLLRYIRVDNLQCGEKYTKYG